MEKKSGFRVVQEPSEDHTARPPLLKSLSRVQASNLWDAKGFWESPEGSILSTTISLAGEREPWGVLSPCIPEPKVEDYN